MKIKYILAAAVVAMLAIPGTASQLAAQAATSVSPVAGAFSDPHTMPSLSIELPTHFTALDIGTHPLQHFAG